MPRYKTPRPINTKTDSVSFAHDVYAVMEWRRETEGMEHLGKPMPRSAYIAQSMIERWKDEGHWPMDAKKLENLRDRYLGLKKKG